MYTPKHRANTPPYKKSLFFVIAICSILSQTTNAHGVNLVFRCDDIYLLEDSFQNDLVETFTSHSVPITLGVIPCNKNRTYIYTDCAFTQNLQHHMEEGNIEIALHGLIHQLQNGNKGIGEFAGKNYIEQFEDLKLGKILLDSVFGAENIITFIPPWNAFDSITEQALVSLNFHIISGAIHWGREYNNPHLSYYPFTISNPTEILNIARTNQHRNATIVCMLHNYDFDGYGIGGGHKSACSMVTMQNILDTINSLPYIHCMTFADLYHANDFCDNQRIQWNGKRFWLQKKLHTINALQTTNWLRWIWILNLLAFVGAPTILTIYTYIQKKRQFYIVLLGSQIIVLFCIVYFHILTPLKCFAIEGFIMMENIAWLVYSRKQKKHHTNNQ